MVQDNPGDWAGPERQCWSRLGSSMQKQETSISQLASGAAPGCFPRRSPPALWGSYRGRGSLESFMRAGLGIGLPVSHQATGDAPSSDTAAWGPWGGGLLAGQPWGGGAGALVGEHSSSSGPWGWPGGGRTPASPQPSASIGITCDASLNAHSRPTQTHRTMLPRPRPQEAELEPSTAG